MGYIGLPTATILAHYGYKVEGVDKNIDTVSSLNRGDVHITEPDLNEYFSRAVNKDLLNIHHDLKLADIYIICVPTPLIGGDVPQPDLSAVFDAVDRISKVIKNDDIIILESTCPVGTTETIYNILNKVNPDIYVAYCPERVMPGNIIKELTMNDRIIGGVNEKSAEIVSKFYASFIDGEILSTDSKTAEMCKLTENSYRDVNIAFANEISLICENYGIAHDELISFANRHPRVDILKPGIGVGGHCIAVDPWFLISSNENTSELMYQARKTNLKKTRIVTEKIVEYSKSFEKINRESPVIAIYGLSYKPDSDDLRCSPAIEIVEVIDKITEVIVVEPNIDDHDKFNLRSSEFARQKSDICIFLVNHTSFRNEFEKGAFADNQIMDFCGLTNETTNT